MIGIQNYRITQGIFTYWQTHAIATFFGFLVVGWIALDKLEVFPAIVNEIAPLFTSVIQE